MDTTFDVLTLARLPGVGPRAARTLAERAPLREVLSRPDDHADLLPLPAVQALRTGAALALAEAELRRAAALGAWIVDWTEDVYPASVRAIYDPPLVLYVRGTLRPTETTSSVTIVGSRNASPQGCALARRMSRDLVLACGATVVSGMARGIDSASHQGALHASGRTIAVLGSSLDHIYPPENARLATAIAESGAVVTEFPFGTPPRPGHFPRRNRILASWGRGVVVVEAGEKSGALVTARIALDEGREVVAVPGHPSQPGAAGTNGLIRDGARLARDARDVAEELGLEYRACPAPTPEPDRVLAALAPGVPLSVDQLVERSGLPTAELLSHLVELELDAKIRRLPGALFLRS